MSNKVFVLDTNVLLHNPAALYSFTDNLVVIPLTVIEELDTFKTYSDKKGKHARQVLRELDAITRKGALGEGAKLRSGGKLKIVLPGQNGDIPLDLAKRDNRIIAVAWHLQQKGEGGDGVFFISKDLNARIKAESLGIKARDYEKQKVEYTSLYRGWREMVMSTEEINTFYKE